MGVGILTLANSNAFTGGTTISSGTISLNNAAALASDTVTVNVNNGLSFNTNLGTTTTFTLGAWAGPGASRLPTGHLGYIRSRLTSAQTVQTDLQRERWRLGQLAKMGSGTLVLSNSNLYGTTTISAGTLQIGNGGKRRGDRRYVDYIDNAALVFNHSDSATLSPVSGTGSLTQTGSGTLTLTAANTFTGPTAILPAPLAWASIMPSPPLGGHGQRHAQPERLHRRHRLALRQRHGDCRRRASVGNDNTSTTFSGLLSGGGSLAKVGSGTWTVSGSNAFSGSTTLAFGLLQVNGSLVGPVTVNSGGVGRHGLSRQCQHQP